jgi:hypothetical protein
MGESLTEVVVFEGEDRKADNTITRMDIARVAFAKTSFVVLQYRKIFRTFELSTFGWWPRDCIGRRNQQTQNEASKMAH